MNNPLIAPIIVPQIDWGTYIDFMVKVTGQSPTRILDFNHKDVGPVSSFLFSLDTNQYTLHLCSYSFLMELTADEHLQILKGTDLKTFKINELVILSGTIKDWREACLDFCKERTDFNLRYLFDCVYIYFNNLKLFTLNKYGLKDQTFILKELNAS